MGVSFKPVVRAEQVADHLRQAVLDALPPGTRMAPVRELAAELGVSVPTIRAAQTLLSREGLLEVRHGSGVFAAARQAQERWVGIYTGLDILAPRTSPFFTFMPRALLKFLRSRGLQAEIYLGEVQPDETEEGPGNLRFRTDVAEGRLQGLAIMTAPATPGWTDWIHALQIPAVGTLTPYEVAPAYDDMVRRAVRRLHQEGCRRIAMLSWSYKGYNSREHSLREALAGLGLEYHPEWSRNDLHPMHSGAGWEEFREVWTGSREKPDGLIVTDDVLFDEALIAIREMRIRVPEQLRVVTYAIKGANKHYPFPVIEALADPVRHAEAMGRMLLQRMRCEPVVPHTELLPVEMAESSRVSAPVKLHRGTRELASQSSALQHA